MKKLLLILTLAFTVSLVSAQFKIGPGITLTPDIGLSVKAQQGITDAIDGSAIFTYYFVETVDAPGFDVSASVITLELNGQYNLDLSDSFTFYPLAGLSIARASSSVSGPGGDTSFSDTEIGLNLGAGINYPLSSFDLFAEAKIVLGGIDDFVLQAGVLFPLGGSAN